jgi:hypothetical protein
MSVSASGSDRGTVHPTVTYGGGQRVPAPRLLPRRSPGGSEYWDDSQAQGGVKVVGPGGLFSAARLVFKKKKKKKKKKKVDFEYVRTRPAMLTSIETKPVRTRDAMGNDFNNI